MYTKNKAEMEQGLEGVKLALKILNEYYSKDALLADKAPPIALAPFTPNRLAHRSFTGVENMSSKPRSGQVFTRMAKLMLA